MKLRIFTPCQAITEDDDCVKQECEGEAGHPGQHWWTLWETDPEPDEDGVIDAYPAYPIYWGPE